MKLITNGRLITRDAEGRGYYEHGAVAYEGARIAEVGEEAAPAREVPRRRDRRRQGRRHHARLHQRAHPHLFRARARACPSSATTRQTSTRSSTERGGPSTAT